MAPGYRIACFAESKIPSKRVSGDRFPVDKKSVARSRANCPLVNPAMPCEGFPSRSHRWLSTWAAVCPMQSLAVISCAWVWLEAGGDRGRARRVA